MINLLRKKDARDHRSFGERVAAMLDRNPFGLELTTEERDELRRAGYGELADLFRKDGASTAKAKDGAVEPYHESVEESRAHYRTRWQPIGEGGTGGKLAYEELTGFTPKGNEFDGYSEMERLMNDRRVSQSARAKAYYILTGHLLSPGTVMDYTTEEDADGIIVKSMTVNGDVVTSRRFKDKESAQREIDKIVRQSELNSIDVGEHYHDGEVRKGLIKEACKAAGFPPDKASPVYERAMRGEDISAAEREMVEAINKKIREMGRSYMDTRDAEWLREVVKDETGIDVDEALHKMPRARTENEQAAIDRYMEKLYPEEARRPKQADSEAATNPYDFDEPTPEQSDAQQAYFEGQKLTEAYHDPSDPAKQAQARANADAIALQMQEAFQLVHEYFDTLDNPDDWKDRLAADPWEVLYDPELPAQKRDDVLYYINSKAALDGIMDAANEAADSRIAEVQRSVDLRTHKETGMVHPATLKVDDKQVYIVCGNVQMFPDGSAVDSRNSSESIVVCDPASGEYSFKSPDAIMRVDEPLDPQQELHTALDAIEADRSSIFGENMTPPTEAESQGPQDNDAEGAPVAMTDTPARETSEGYRNDELGISNDENPEKDVTLSGNTEKANAERESGPEQSNDERTQSREDDGSTMAGDAAGSMARDRDRGNIRVYEPGLASERNGDSGYSARDRREAESERLVGIAKKQGQYVPLSELRNLGERRRKATGESEVYEDLPNGRIYKVKNPYAKAPMKGNVQPEDAIYEHLVHNKYFPETPYRFEGISDDGGDVRIVLSQGYVESVGQPTKEQIDAALAERGLYPEGNYRYGNDEISVTDVTGDNALLGADGKVYFIDPIIDFKRPVREILGEAEGAGGAQVTAPMPMRKVKVKEGGKTVEYDEPDYMAVSPRRGHAYIFNESGLDRKEANELLDNLAKEAKDKLDKHNKAMPKIGTSVARFKAQKAAWEQRRAELQRSVDYWNEVKAEQRKVFDAEQAERAAQDKQAHDEAVAKFEEQQRVKAQKDAEQQERIGTHAVNPKIRERWEAAPKVEGYEDALTLPDDSTITGRYILTEAGAASPSHDANNAYEPTEGFPIDENGQSVNDRDYQRDKDAQRIVEDIAGSYDNRALQDPVIVSNDGVVLSGNNRTMSGDLAARQGTDKAYNDYLLQYGYKKFGFTPEQVQSMKNPRVVFVPDEPLPYDATTFARFNAQEKKSQGKPEAAVKLGKIVPDNVFTDIVNDISRYDRLSDYYGDEKAVAHALGALMQAGVINDMQMPGLRTGTAISATGKELIENTLIGKVFQASPDAVRQIISVPTLRQSILMALSEIANNRTLASKGYDISEELSKAVDLVARAKTEMPDIYKDGMPVSPFGRMQGLFDDEFGDSRVTDATTLLLADILNSGKPSDLRKVLSSYNNEAAQAAGGQIDMYLNSIPTKEDILTQVNKIFRNATPKEQQALVDAAIAERKRRAEAEAEQRGRDQESEQTPNGAERGAEPQQLAAGAEDELTPKEQALVGRVEITDNEWTEGEGDKPTYKREIIIDGTHKATQVDAPDDGGHYTGSYFEFDGKRFGDIADIAQYIDGGMKSEPTEAQKAAGNYKMEHRKVDGYNISIENPKGSVRRGTSKDKDGNETPWETTMQNDYGYIRGTEGVDGDHIDVFLSDTPEEGDVFVIDQVNKDGSFDEHKVMYGFPSEEAAREAYLSNYEPGWTGLGAITHVSKDEFKKWIGSSKRKTKPFVEYKSVKPIRYDSQGNPIDENGNLIIEDVKSVADITDADFTEPTRTVGLPTLPEIVQRVLSTNGKKVIIKKNIFERNALRHDELTPEVSRAILNEALYNPTLYGKNKPLSRPNNWIVINVPDGKGNNKLVVLEVNENKDNVEIVHWHEVDNRGLEKIKRQAEREDGQLLILPSESSEEAGALSGPTFDSPNEKLSPSSEMRLTEAPSESEGPDLVPTSDNVISSDRKVNTLSADKQAESAESSRGALSASPQHSPVKSGSAFGSHDNSEPYTITPTKYEGKHKTSDVWFVNFNRELTAEEKAALDTFAREPLTEGKKTSRGWYDHKQGGYMMRTEEAAKELAEMIGDEEAVADRQPLTPSELREATAPAKAPAKPKKKPAPMNRVNVESLFGALKRDGEAKLSDHAEPVQYKDPLTEDVIATLAKWDMSPTHKLAASRLVRNYSISYVRAERILREIQELSAAAKKEAPKSEPKPAEPAKEYEVSDEELGDIFKEMRDILGTDDADVDSDFKFRDPEEMTKDEKRKLSALGMRAAMALIERGKTSFTDYARAMIGGLGDDVRPWLKSFYEAARLTPGFEDYDLSDREEVMATDIANFDKQRGPIAAANTIATERKAEAAVAEGEKSLKETRNKQRRENDKQTETDTAALAEKAEAVAGKAEGLAETSEDTGELSRASAEIDKTLDEVNDQLALLGYYEAEEVDKDFNEAYGYMRNAERKAVNDAVKLAKQLVTDLGIDIKVTGQITPLKSKGKSKKTAVSGNVAPAGGDVSIRLPLNEGRELYINIGLEPAGKQEGDAHNRPYYRDDLHVRGIMYRVEWPDEKGHTSFERMGRNRWADDKVTYGDLLNAIRREVKDYLPTAEAAEPQTNKGEEAYHGTITLKDGREAVVVAANHVQNIGEPSRLTDYIVGVKGEPGTIKIKPDEIAHAGAPTEEDKPSTPAKAEQTYNGYKIGDEVMWDRYGNGKWEKQRIIDFDAQGHPIFDSFGQSWITEVGDWERIKPVDGVFGEAKRVARVNAEKKAATQSAVDLLRGDKKSKKKSVSSQKKPEVKPEQPIGGLFGGLFDNEPDNERTEVGTGSRETGGQRQQLEPNPQVGGGEPRRETERPAGTAGGGSPRMDSDADRAGGRGLHDVAEKPALAPISEKDKKNTHNNHVERGTEVAPKTEGARIKANIAAIETMKRLMESGEAAKPADMKKLRAYSGWGGLGSAFTDPATSRQLKGLLGEQDYNEGAEMSRNSAYFTPAYIVDTMWDLARLLGFKGGRMLEGSAGIGNILGLMPQDFAERTDIRAIEKDPTTGAMLRLLYPDSDVDIDGFEKVKLETGGYDLVMTNVPFVPGLKIVDTSGDGDISKRFHTAIHDLCIAKGVRKLRDGGIGIFISTAGSMDATGKLYEWLNTRENADIIGLFRMHRDTFGGTNATTDIILVRKRVNGVKSPLAIDCGLNTGVRVAEYDTGETNKNGDPIIKRLPMSYNRYLVEHPEYVAGEMRFGFEEGDTFRPESKGCYPVKEKDQPSMLQQWVADMAQRIAESPEEVASTSVVNHRDEYVPTYDKVGNEVKTGTIVIDTQGHVCVNYDGTARPLMSTLDKKNPKSEADRIAQFNKNKVKGRTRVQVVQDYNAIKKALNEWLEFQKTSESDEGLKPKLAALNRAFDQFVSTYGHLHGNNGLSWLRNDVDYPSVFALETYREEGLDHKPVFGKADIFTRRVVVRPEQPKATTVRDGVTLSIRQNGVLDTRFIAEQLGKSEDEVKREVIEAGLGYENPLTHVMEAAHEYLSGNVREKLHQAETNNEDGRYSPNITALRKVVPHDIPSHFIEFSIGSSWIRPEIFEEYIKEKTGTNVKCTYAGGMWDVDIPRYVREQDKAFGIRSEICDKVITGSELIAAAMTNRTIRVTKTQKDGPNINDPKATSACAAKVDEIRDDFKSWLRGKMQSNPELANEIEVTYNDIFNNSAPMTIPDEYVPEYFDGAARSIGGKDIKMRKHQSKAIVRGTMQSLMLAHEVGTGKTFTLITTAMEMRRLGTAKKPMIVVQNATLGQFVASAKALYPDARILSLDDKDRNAEGRKDFYAKIRYNDWDMVVIPQSVLERIPDHPDRERRFIEEAIEEKMEVIEAMSRDREQSKAAAALKKEVEKLNQRLAEIGDADKTTEDEETGDRIMAPAKGKKKDGKKAAITKENAKTHAEEMLNRATDNTLNFDDLGVDAILVDEAHEYKHLGFATAMQRGVKGVDPSYSKKCQGLYLKVKAVQEKSGGRNVIFATGTPISNTAAEIWTFMRYLLPREVMEGHNIWHFDDFVRNFGSIQQMLEFTTAGSYKENNRFAGYTNLPELARIWAGIADTVLTAEAGEVKKQIPELEGDKPTDIYLPQTNGLRAVLKYVRAQLKAYEEMSGQEKKENSHIPLVMYGIAKAAAIDARLVMPNAPDDPHSKTNEAVRQTLRSLDDSKAYNGTVAIFADNYQRKNKETGAVEFNLFEDIRDKLIAQGVPAEQIVIMRDGMTDKKKEKIFAQVNAGEVRVILGTTQRLGVGVNIQERLHTLMHIDAPNRPMDYWQRMGRLLRQGNLHKEMGIPVRVIRFGVEDSLDVTAYQRLKTKGAIADAIMHSKALLANNLDNRVLEEEGDEFGNITAELSGSQYAMLLNQAEKELRKLLAAQDQHRQHQMYIHRAEPRLRETIERMQAKTERSDEILALLESNPNEIRINGKTYKSRNELDKVYEAHNKSVAERKKQAQTMDYDKHIKTELTFQVGELLFGLQSDTYRGIVGYGSSGAIDGVIVRQKLVCPQLDIDQEMGDVALKRIINVLFDEVLSGKQERTNREGWVNAKERAEADLAQILKDKGKPFEHGDRIAELQQKVDEYSEAMQAELKEKEDKYAAMDAEVEEATDITFTEEDDDVEGEKSSNGDGQKFRLIEDSESELLDFLNAQRLKPGWRYAQWADYGIRPPMTAKVNGEWRPRMQLGRWEQSEEGMMNKDGKADLVQGNGRTTGNVAYNPYFHIRTSPMNDQFSAAWDRPELLPIFGYYPESEETSGYHAEGAKNSVGLMSWHSGTANGQLTEGNKIKTMLSRYFKPERIASWSEVADEISPALLADDVRMPINVVPPMLRAELAKRGVKFGPISGSVSEADVEYLNDILERVNNGEWNAGLERAQAYVDAYESRPEVMGARVDEISQKLHTPMRVLTPEETAKLPTRRERRAKGWYDPKTGEIVINLVNNDNVADVENTALHEAAGHYGLSVLVGEENMPRFLDEVYNHASTAIRNKIDAVYEKRRQSYIRNNGGGAIGEAHFVAEGKEAEFRRDATEEYMSDLGGRIGEKGFEKMEAEELTFWGKVKELVNKFLDKFLRGLNIAKSIKLSDKHLGYILYKSWKNLKNRGPIGEAEDITMRRRSGYDETPEDELKKFRDGDSDMGLEETITKMKADAAQANADNLQKRNDAMRAIGANLNHLRQAMARQREYDLTTVRSVTDLAKILMDANLLDNVSKSEMKTLLGTVNQVVGRKDVTPTVQRVMDLMVKNQLRNSAAMLSKLLSIRGSKVDAKGVEVQGELDAQGQEIARVMKKTMHLPVREVNVDGELEPGCLESLLQDATDRMGDSDPLIAEAAANDVAGLNFAMEYAENVTKSKAEEQLIQSEMKKAEAEKLAGRMTPDAYKQFAEAAKEQIRTKRIERVEAYHDLIGRLAGELGESVTRAAEFKDNRKNNIADIHHNANSDMEGRPLRGQRKDSRLEKLNESPLIRMLLEPLATFDQMLRMFGGKNANGEGYIWNRFMHGWVKSAEREQVKKEQNQDAMDAEAAAVLGKKKGWNDLYDLNNALPKSTVSFWDGGEMREHEMSQLDLLTLLLWDAQPMGRATLRKMNVDDAKMAEIEAFIDPRLREIGRWMVDYLGNKRLEFNEVHKEMFGASMAANENYFPFRRAGDEIKREVENGTDPDNDRPSTTTGSIIKRRFSVTPFDIVNCNAADLFVQHLNDMEHWAAFGPLNRDLGILLSYKRFKQQVKNMRTIYGSGSRLWKLFSDCCAIATESYQPKTGRFDKALVRATKGVAMGKVNLRPYTALKQTLSLPAFLPDCDVMALGIGIATAGIVPLRWCWENMPLFRKRILSRTAGDYRLKASQYDTKIMKFFQKGMLPNIGVDAWTVAVGCYSVFKAREKRYIRQGMSKEQAKAKAIRDAEISFNESQQSSEGPFLAPIQVDHSAESFAVSLFRNSAYSYTRKAHEASRNLRNLTTGESTVEFMKKQLMREGMEGSAAEKEAKRLHRKAYIKNSVQLAVFGWILPWLWRLGGLAPLLLLSSDDDQKDKAWNGAIRQSMFGPIEGTTAGDVTTTGLNMAFGNEDVNWEYVSKQSPIFSDMAAIQRTLDKDAVAATNDVLNIIVGMGTGLNPQTVTDMATAIVDACDADPETSREAALLWVRLLNVPQSQIDQIYFEEVDMNGREASKLSPEELAERYAEYKTMRNAPLTQWIYNEDERDEVLNRHRKHAEKGLKEVVHRRVLGETGANAEDLADWEDEYKATEKRLKRINDLKEHDKDKARKQRHELIGTPEYHRYLILKRYHYDVNELTKQFLSAKTAEERDTFASRMKDLHAKAIERLERSTEYVQQ